MTRHAGHPFASGEPFQEGVQWHVGRCRFHQSRGDVDFCAGIGGFLGNASNVRRLFERNAAAMIAILFPCSVGHRADQVSKSVEAFGGAP